MPLDIGLQRVFAKRTRALFYANGMWLAIMKARKGLIIFNSHPVGETGEVFDGITARAFYCDTTAKTVKVLNYGQRPRIL